MNSRGLHLHGDTQFDGIITSRMIKGLNDHQGLLIESKNDEKISMKNNDYIENTLRLGK
jgi:hypothetical protein